MDDIRKQEDINKVDETLLMDRLIKVSIISIVLTVLHENLGTNKVSTRLFSKMQIGSGASKKFTNKIWQKFSCDQDLFSKFITDNENYEYSVH